MFAINTITEDSYRVLQKFNDNMYIIDYYGDSLLIETGDTWKIVIIED